jgi:hypothetical protein
MGLMSMEPLPEIIAVLLVFGVFLTLSALVFGIMFFGTMIFRK